MDDIAQGSPGVNITFVQLEPDNQKSVRQAVEEVKKLDTKIDGFINNAALMACPYSKTMNEIETQFETNWLGHFLFTNLLLQANVIPDGAHIVNVSSSASEMYETRPYFHDLTYQDGKTYDTWVAYSVSKRANVLYTRSLAVKLKARNITILSLNPGSIRSPLQRYLNEKQIQSSMKRIMEQNPNWKYPEHKSLKEGCSTTLRLLLTLALQGGFPQPASRCHANLFDRHFWGLPR